MQAKIICPKLPLYSTIAVGMMSFLITGCTKLNAQKGPRPNVLIIMTDQQRWDALGVSGANNIIKTPNIDRLAQRGAYFRSAISPCPVSGPARTSMLTGRLAELTGIKTNPDADKDGINKCKSYDEIFALNNYTTEYYGKFHSPKEMAEVYRNPPYMGLTGSEQIKKWELTYKRVVSENIKRRSLIDGEQYESSFYPGIPYKMNPLDIRYGTKPEGVLTGAQLKERKMTQPDQHGTLDLDNDYTITAMQAQQTIDALSRLKNKRFILTCSFHAPHAPILPTEPYASMYKASEMPVPISISDDMANNPYRNSSGRMGKKEYADASKIGYMMADYYAFITEIDDWTGKILDKLDNLGLTDNTIIVFVSDHGEMLGSHGMREKNVFLEESVRVPLIISYPKLIQGSRVIDTPVSTINIFPTLMDLAGIKGTASDGISLVPLINGKEAKYPFAVSEWNWSSVGQITPNLMIRTAEWKLIMSYQNKSGALDALFDLKNDPYEMNNLLGSNSNKNQYIATAEKLQEQLVLYLEEKNYPLAAQIKTRKL